MKDTKVIAGFPGIGKTTYTQKHPELIIYDSDSSQFPKDETWPQNYINHIQSKVGEADIIFTSTHEAVLKAMRDADIDFAVFIPAEHQRSAWVKNRIENRTTGLNNEKFCQLIRDNMDEWIEALKESDYEVYSVWSIELGINILDSENWHESFGICPFCHKPFELQICDDEGNWRNSDYLYEPWSGLSFVITHNEGFQVECLISTDKDNGESVGNYSYSSALEAKGAVTW